MKIQFKSTIAGLSKAFPPQPAAAVKPAWLRGPRFHAGFDRATPLEQASRGASTVRRCPGVLDAMRNGFIVPLWTDIHVKYDGMRGDVAMRAALPWAKIDRHPVEQFKSTPIELLASPYPCVFKLENPWRVHLPAGYSSWTLDALYHRPWMGFAILPGFVNHDEFHTANIFLAWQRYDVGELILAAGTPLFQLIPVRRSGIGLSVEDAPEEARTERAGENLKVGGWAGRYRRLFSARRQ